MNGILLVDKNYMALSIISIKKTIKLLVKGKAEPIPVSTNNSIVITTSSGMFNVPSIIRLLITIPWKAHKSRMKFSRRNVMIRDEYKCKYCGVKLGKNGGTIDHIIPKSRGGKTTYANCVASCKSCNNKKADKTLEQAGLKIDNKPKSPEFTMLYKQYLNDDLHSEWLDYIIGI